MHNPHKGFDIWKEIFKALPSMHVKYVEVYTKRHFQVPVMKKIHKLFIFLLFISFVLMQSKIKFYYCFRN